MVDCSCKYHRWQDTGASSLAVTSDNDELLHQVMRFTRCGDGDMLVQAVHGDRVVILVTKHVHC